ncbi:MULTISPECIES: type II secretion system F family protein [unclassified Micromonospora]|uniref:type II secretion system F family protein n=1 Tax=unclassified Micromonospora TaxID=2617518 RepID=UPI001B36F20D|nr:MULTISPECIES: type II secretion system F family protein [unclassified Micromonospora]MBQ1042050.1 type II secretion system F family protein [Micromonospora sp. C72]MBQ1054344.1 type II secretion system F family protein [Micromonospora sp. C32]
MARQVLAALCLGGAASLLAVAAPAVRPARRLRRLAPAPRRPRPPWWPDRVRLSAALAGLAVPVVVGGWSGLALGLLAGVAADRLLRRIEPRAARDRRLRETADLPLAADLLAAALRAGAPVDRSVLAVAEALGGPLADRLGRVGRTLGLGGTATEAWAHLSCVAGAEPVVTAAVRSSNSGAALARALTRLADDLRAERSTAAEAAARRAGVLIVLPLGLCFLPAFILAGLVPVIVAVLGDVL